LEYKLNILNKGGKMKNKIYQKVLKRIVMFVVLLLLLLPVVSFAQAEVYTIDLGDYNLPVWDFSGDYYTYASYHDQVSLYISFDIAQDAVGKVTGYGNVEVGALGYYFDVPVEVKGKINVKNGIVTFKFSLKGEDDFSLYGEDIWLKVMISGATVVLNRATGTMYGTAKAKMCAKANVQGQKISGCDKSDEIVMDLDVPYGMTGGAILEIDAALDEKDKKLEGSGELTLSNGDEYPLYVKGKYNSKKAETKLSLKGSDEASKKIKVKLSINERSGTATDINAKALGKKLKYKQ
jgi:hypothetical protein